MKSNLPKKFKQGDELTASLINDILEEIWRWRQMEAMPPLHISEADSSAPPLVSLMQEYVNIAWGNTGSGFSAASGTPPVPTSQDIYLYDVAPGNPPVLTAQASTTKVWCPYSGGSIASNKTALCGQTLDGTWWIITADC